LGWEGDRLRFAEVKRRTGWDVMDPAEAAVDGMRRMARMGLRGFPRERREAVRVRFDGVSVYLQPDGTDRSGIELDV
jgi:hypothetical protein